MSEINPDDYTILGTWTSDPEDEDDDGQETVVGLGPIEGGKPGVEFHFQRLDEENSVAHSERICFPPAHFREMVSVGLAILEEQGE